MHCEALAKKAGYIYWVVSRWGHVGQTTAGRLITLKLLTSLMAQLMSFGTNRQLDNWTGHHQMYRLVGKTAERKGNSSRDKVMI